MSNTTTTTKEVTVILDTRTHEVYYVLDPEGEDSSCGGWNGYCGGCDKCLFIQAQHAISKGDSIEICWVTKANLDIFLGQITVPENLGKSG